MSETVEQRAARPRYGRSESNECVLCRGDTDLFRRVEFGPVDLIVCYACASLLGQTKRQVEEGRMRRYLTPEEFQRVMG